MQEECICCRQAEHWTSNALWLEVGSASWQTEQIGGCCCFCFDDEACAGISCVVVLVEEDRNAILGVEVAQEIELYRE